MIEADPDSYTNRHFKRPEMGILRIIYVAIATLALLLIGSIELYKRMDPETPTEQLAHAVDALDSGQNLIAYRLLNKLAEQGNPAAKYWLADLYEYGLGTAKDVPEAVALLQCSADKGFVPAQLRLGELYLAGVDIDPDYSKAKDLLGKAAGAANAEAQRLLGQMYAAGLGGPRDPFLAAAYFSAAASHGDPLAAQERDSIEAQLSPDQVGQIQLKVMQLGLSRGQGGGIRDAPH